ncbi:hypothetical protein OTU49_008883, partial [Cherax quadricarinatus]
TTPPPPPLRRHHRHHHTHTTTVFTFAHLRHTLVTMESQEGVRSRPTAHSVYTGVGDEEGEENVEELRERLRQMKAMVSERATTKKSGIDEGFLSVVFACILVVIAGVTLYAFVVLYAAVHRRWTENPDD